MVEIFDGFHHLCIGNWSKLERMGQLGHQLNCSKQHCLQEQALKQSLKQGYLMIP
jgi:hypothetical protein